MRQLYLAATGMNRGKTTVSLGLLAALFGPRPQDRLHQAGRPALRDGRRRAGRRGRHPHEDDLRPARPTGRHQPGAHPAGLHQGVHQRPRWSRTCPRASGRRGERVAVDRDVLLVEGTGHAGVGSVIDLSNADVAGMLGRPRGHRQRGWGRSADRRDRAQPRPLHAPRGRGRRRRRQQGRPRRPPNPGRRPASRAWRSTASSCSASCPTTPLLSNPTLSMLQ